MIRQFLTIKSAIFLFCATLCGTAIAQQQDDLSVSYVPIWQGNYSGMPVLPIRVELSNDGNSEIVELISKSGDTQISTFVEMPKGSTKQREMYVAMRNYWESPTLIVRRGFSETEIPIELRNGASFNAEGSVRIAQISDGVGSLAMLRVSDRKIFQNKAWASGFEDFSIQPGLAPTRSIGYRGLDVLFLGEGSERLTDAEVNAIKSAVLGGLHLVFVGGAINPVLADPRWQGFIPIYGTSAVFEGRATKWGSELSNVAFPSLSMLRAAPIPSALVKTENGTPMISSHAVGAGVASFVAFNPFDAGFRNWGGKFAFMYDLAANIPADLETESIDEEISRVTQTYDNYGYYDDSSGVFGIEMPSWERVAAVLLAYLLIVVPVNFLVLRKLGRGELAWITAPLLAIGFAGILFGFAGKLYSAEPSRSAYGVVIASANQPELVVVASQQLFFPGSGAYDLKFSGVEYVGSNTGMYEYSGPFGRPQVSNAFQDFDGVSATRYSVNNLSFREFWMHQRVPVMDPDLITYKVTPAKEDFVLAGEVTNPYPFELFDILMVGPGISKVIGSMKPGESRPFKVRTNGNIASGTGLMLRGRCTGESFGAQFGRDVSLDGLSFYYNESLEGM